MQMRFVKMASAFGLLVLIAACTSSEGLPHSTSTGGSVSTGGSLATGGAIWLGGNTGGNATGGIATTGGRVSTGGTPSSGGATSAGGSGGTVSLTSCGGTALLRCTASQWCEMPENTCEVDDVSGTCTTAGSGICPTIWAPVCGCNNKTYGSDCERRFAKVSKRSDGECPVDAGTADTTKPTTGSENSVCGYDASTDCKIGLYCNFPSGTCGTGGASGTCTRPFSGACGAVYEPVCGCDGETYSNGCMLAITGVSMKSTGTCR